MRANIKMSFDGALTLPIHYNYILQAVVLKWINDENYSKFIHNTGYEYNNRRFKMYTFSRLEGKYQINKEDKTITYLNEANLIVSTADDEFMKYLINNVLTNDNLIINKIKVRVEKVQVQYMDIENGGTIITQSPIVVYSSFEHEGKTKTYYYNPKEDEFEKLLRENLIKKYKAFYNKEPRDISFKIKAKEKVKQNIVMYKGLVIKGWSGEFEVDGSLELLKIAYDTGLGAKNSQGFGCFEFK